jgi:hypothetical protein
VRKPLLAFTSVVVLLSGACSGGSHSVATPSALPTLEQPSATPTSIQATPTPGLGQVPSRALLFDVASGRVITLHESLTQMAWRGRFDGDVVEVGIGDETRRFNPDGSVAAPSKGPSCAVSGGSVEINGSRFTDVANCGVFSPDGRWMMFERPAGDVTTAGGITLPSWDQWVLEVGTGSTRELQKGLVHCGGCDGRYGPRWSPTSRYVAYAEFGGPRRFLSDLVTGQTRLIGGGSDISFAPQWAPTGNRLIYATAATLPANARFEDLDHGVVNDLPIPWPVAFDASGLYLYSPIWGGGPKATGQTTTVISAATLAPVATLPGVPPQWGVWREDSKPVVFGANGLVAALQGAASCDGTSVSVAAEQAACVAGGTAGVVNPGASQVAVAKVVGTTGPVHGPGFETISLTRYDIELFDVSTGQGRTVLSDVLSWDFQAPIMVWNAEGTQLLVLAPSAVGL